MTTINNHVYLSRTRDKRARGRDAEDPCWEGFEQRGTKEKGGKTVPNCVTEDGRAKRRKF